VTLPTDPSPELADYAHPERLVTTEWLQEHAGAEGLVILESNEDVLLYDTGHIPGAVKIDWHTELNDPVVRDYLQGEAFAELMSRKGISRDDTVVIYGDKSNWWAAYTLWVFTLFGHDDVRLLNGGRDAWVSQGLPLTKEIPSPSPSTYPVVERNDADIRAFKEDTWFVMKYLLGFENVKNYDGSWTEWGSAVRVPIATGDQPGEAP
jgi:thiosulfate/3-mercaptopyruvate sulfurtransferase